MLEHRAEPLKGLVLAVQQAVCSAAYCLIPRSNGITMLLVSQFNSRIGRAVG